jgi:hypothetical protein
MWIGNRNGKQETGERRNKMPAKINAYVLRMSVWVSLRDKYEGQTLPVRVALPAGTATGEPGCRMKVSNDQNYGPWFWSKKKTLEFATGVGMLRHGYLIAVAQAVCKLQGWNLPTEKSEKPTTEKEN